MNIQIQKYWKILLRWWWLLVISAIIPAGISYYFESKKAPLYQAKATVVVGGSIWEDPNPDLRQLSLSNTLANAYAELVRQGPVIEAVIEQLGLNSTPTQLVRQINTRIYSGAHLLEIQITDTNPQAAAWIANALATEMIRRSPSSAGNDPEQQDFIRIQLEEIQDKIQNVAYQIEQLTGSLDRLNSAAEIRDVQSQIAALEEVKTRYQSSYAELLAVYRAESPNALSLFDEAVVPQWPLPSKTKLIVAIAGAAGIGLAVSIIILIEFLDTSLRWEESNKNTIQDLPVLGIVPQSDNKVTLPAANPLSPVAEGMRTTRSNIFLLRPENPYRILQLSSPNPSEGKSFAVANLATVLATAGNRVIVIDADMRRPALHEYFGLANVTGLSDILNQYAHGEQAAQPFLQETDNEELKILTAGRPPVDPAALLTSEHFPHLLETLLTQANVLLIDSPPVLDTPDATILATLVEGTLLVVSEGQTRQDLIQKTRERLEAQEGITLLGVIVNRAKHKSGTYYYQVERKSILQKLLKYRQDDDTWLTLDETAHTLGISKAMARQWCKNGRLTVEKKFLLWQVKHVDVIALIQTMTGNIKEPVSLPEA